MAPRSRGKSGREGWWYWDPGCRPSSHQNVSILYCHRRSLVSPPFRVRGLGFRARSAVGETASLLSCQTPPPPLARARGTVRFEIRARLADQGLGSASGPPRPPYNDPPGPPRPPYNAIGSEDNGEWNQGCC